MTSNDECPICLSNFVDKSVVKDCQHNFCFKCIFTWTKQSTKCPLCKNEMLQILHNIQEGSKYEIYNIEIPRDNAEGINMNSFSDALNVVNDSAIKNDFNLIHEEMNIIDSLEEEENEQLARDDFNLIHEEMDEIDFRENFDSIKDEIIEFQTQALETEVNEELERFYFEDDPVSFEDILEYERYQDECHRY